MIHFNNPSFGEVTSKEWLVTNGIGGFASSSICGANTRRYHGLLVAALNPPTDRQVVVSKVLESIRVERQTVIGLSTNDFPGLVHPDGYRYLKAFDRCPLPAARFEVDNYQLRKTVFMRYGSNTTVVEYTNESNKAMTLELNPLFVWRDYHGLFREDGYYDFFREIQAPGLMKIHAHYGSAPMYMRFFDADFHQGGDWYRSFQYKKEAYRGLDFQEDTYSLGHLTCCLEPGDGTYLAFSTDHTALEGDPTDWKRAEMNRWESLGAAEDQPSFIKDLMRSGDQFLVNRKSTGEGTIIAGYPWFTDWGRDTMIAMRGLTIAMGKKELSQSIVRTFLAYLDEGMIPNRFPDRGEAPEYNTIDATLWMFVVLFEYYERFEDLGFIREVFPKLQEIIEAHISGTRYAIHVTEEGLLAGGEGFSQLTWMDAKVGDYVVTPRHGCPVEVNALWFNAVEVYNFFYPRIFQEPSPYEELAKRVGASFLKHFTNDKGYLNDVVVPDSHIDDSIRPNQIYAISLPFSPLDGQETKTVLETVESHLYTDLGLRSLSPEHPEFRAKYGGDQWHRDSAYHQGTVWAFLWGEYAMAYLKYHQFSVKACEDIWNRSSSLRDHFYKRDCLYAISEIFDGQKPFEGRGCYQQAWSIGMLLRVFMDKEWKYPVDVDSYSESQTF